MGGIAVEQDPHDPNNYIVVFKTNQGPMFSFTIDDKEFDNMINILQDRRNIIMNNRRERSLQELR